MAKDALGGDSLGVSDDAKKNNLRFHISLADVSQK